MFYVKKPKHQSIQKNLDQQSEKKFSYLEIGATRDEKKIPNSYTVYHNCIQLGEGLDCFKKAKAALQNWEMFKLGWVELCWPQTQIIKGATVGILVNALGLWSLNFCRVVYVEDKTSASDKKKFSFAYGSLFEHAERGEERFTIEWNRETNQVNYDILAFSRPQQFLSKLGSFYVRRLQKSFARDSLRAMQKLFK